MRKTKEILRLRLQQGRTVRQTAAFLGLSTGVVSKLSSRAKDRFGEEWHVVVALAGRWHSINGRNVCTILGCSK